eukprot:m.106130 g.106130  ORF g.106130 m.106130 type:complete len:168 (-) comp10574_c0_seq5:1463-1966(-)
MARLKKTFDVLCVPLCHSFSTDCMHDVQRLQVAYNYIENQVLLYGSLYHDARSSGFHTHHNVVVGGPMWLYLQWGQLGAVNHLLIEDNYHNQTTAGGCATPEHSDTCQSTGFCPAHYPPSTCGEVVLQNNVLVNGSTWPQAALAIESSAGPQPSSLSAASSVPLSVE